jgi:hypothetical protein
VFPTRIDDLVVPHRRIEPEGDEQPEIGMAAGERRTHQRLALLLGQGNYPPLAFGEQALADAHRYPVDPAPFDSAIEQVRQGRELPIDRASGGTLILALLLVRIDCKLADRVEPQ